MNEREGTLPNETDQPMSNRLTELVETLRAEDEVPAAWRDNLAARLQKENRARTIRSRLALALATAAVLVLSLVTFRTRSASPVRLANAVHFELQAPSTAKVSVVGDFDGWNPRAMPMRYRSGSWRLDVSLPAGRHVFAYAVDGRLVADPSAALSVDDNFGIPSSVIVVAARN